MLPDPAAVQADPAEAEQVQVAPTSSGGSVSRRTAPWAASGPALVTVIV